MNLTTYADRPAWKADRRSGAPDFALGATDVARILGVSTYGGPWAVWKDAHHGRAERKEGADATAGHEWEPVVIDWYGRHFSCEVVSPLCRIEAGWMRPSPDAFARRAGKRGGLEAKCPMYWRDWGRNGTVIDLIPVINADGKKVFQLDQALAAVPASHLLQVYFSLAASGLPWWDIVAFFGPQDTRVIRVLRDETYQRWLVDTVGEWRERYLVGGDEPPYDASNECRLHLVERVGDRGDREREATDDEHELVLKWSVHRDEAKDNDRARKEIAAEIIADMGAVKTITFTHAGRTARFTIDTRGTPRLSGVPKT